MGLASALNTALTGLTAAETIIDVVGNNLANAGTVGFKASEVNFASQLLQTRSLGSGPTGTSGGTNPRQIGLGVQVAEISPDFTQGTVEVSSNPSDIAIQGDGFFVVQASSGEELYTRNGIFKTNSSNELVTIGGQRVLGYGVNENFVVDTTEVRPLTIPLGSEAIAEATRNAFFQGTLTPTGDLASTAEIINSVILGDSQYYAPTYPSAPGDIQVAVAPSVAGSAGATSGAGATLAAGTYNYKVVYYDANGNETLSSSPFSVTLGASAAGIDLTGLPTAAVGDYVGRRIYRTDVDQPSTATYYRVADESLATAGAAETDASTNNTTDPLSTTNLTGQYQYYITYYNPSTQIESRPSAVAGPLNVVNGRIRLDNLPPSPTAPADDPFVNSTIRIYRNTAAQSNIFFRVDEITNSDIENGEVYIDDTPDSAITSNDMLDFVGPKILTNTNLVDIVKRDGSNYIQMFGAGTISFDPKKNDRSFGTNEVRTFTIHDGSDPDVPASTVADLLTFFEQSFGIVKSDGNNGILDDLGSGDGPGATIDANGRIRIIGNNGVDNAIEIEGGSIVYTAGGASTVLSGTKDLGFFSTQSAIGQSAVTNFNAYDSLGEKINVRVTAILESRTPEATTYRWFAESPDNAYPEGAEGVPQNMSTNVGTGLITFDGKGNVIPSTTDNTTVTINRAGANSAITPLVFNLDFTKMSGLSTAKSSLTAFEQDGSPRGELTSFIISESGLISGVFSNGKSRDLGQLLLARFNNPNGLEQKGSNLFGAGVNSGLPIVGAPGEQGIGTIISGATELSNTDVGKNLIDLILASSQYRGNTRVITTAQQLLDELLNLRR